ncbi:hypothetical protein [Kosakonia radicincitans]|uniref:hypothetical protein n=1 Tax=Kosakonia radicincitans TaxID=283686 RepID=UPI001D082B26|nr:hypothetical protein [Kosakonia radicincitans]
MYFYKKKLSIAITTIVCLNSQAVALQIPPGFGELAKSQLIWLDVSLYGESLGLYQADVDLEKVRFLHPEKLIRAISKRYDDTSALKSVLETGLSRSLARNDNMSCSTGGTDPDVTISIQRVPPLSMMRMMHGRTCFSPVSSYLKKKQTPHIFVMPLTVTMASSINRT